MNKKRIIIAIVVLCAVVLLGYRFFVNKNPDVGGQQVKTEVNLVRAGVFSESILPLELSGEVRSLGEARLVASVPGKVSDVYVRAGDSISSGAVLVELENSSEKASLAQSDALLMGARQSIRASELRSNSSLVSEKQAFDSGVSTYKTVFSAIEDAVTGKLDSVFKYAQTGAPELKFGSPIGIELAKERVLIGEVISRLKSRSFSVSEENVPAYLSELKSDLLEIRDFINLVSGEVNSLSESEDRIAQSTIDTWKTNMSLARASADSAFLSTTNAIELINTRTSASALGEIEFNDFGQDSILRATLSSQEAQRQAAISRLEQTIFRAPISGVVSRVAVRVGDYVLPGSIVAQVSGEGGIEIVSSINTSDRKYIKTGGNVLINDKFEGIITSVDSAIDPTNKSLEIHIGLVSTSSPLISGEYVEIEVERTAEDDLPILLPLSSIKMSTRGASVVTVGDEGRANLIPVTLGAILGDRVIILSGINRDTLIVEDARGIDQGEELSIKQ